jgi:hypothetical protein
MAGLLVTAGKKAAEVGLPNINKKFWEELIAYFP